MNVRFSKSFIGLGAVLLVSACGTSDQTVDHGLNNHPLEAMTASVWVAPDGCKHWIIDDGVEGYLTPILKRDGTPDCA